MAVFEGIVHAHKLLVAIFEERSLQWFVARFESVDEAEMERLVAISKR